MGQVGIIAATCSAAAAEAEASGSEASSHTSRSNDDGDTLINERVGPQLQRASGKVSPNTDHIVVTVLFIQTVLESNREKLHTQIEPVSTEYQKVVRRLLGTAQGL